MQLSEEECQCGKRLVIREAVGVIVVFLNCVSTEHTAHLELLASSWASRGFLICAQKMEM